MMLKSNENDRFALIKESDRINEKIDVVIEYQWFWLKCTSNIYLNKSGPNKKISLGNNSIIQWLGNA